MDPEVERVFQEMLLFEENWEKYHFLADGHGRNIHSAVAEFPSFACQQTKKMGRPLQKC